MIIKFKTRKNIYTAKQLTNYILLDKGRIEHPFASPIFLQNIDNLDLSTMHKYFLKNSKFLKKRKNSVAIYHEILSISPQDSHFVTNEMLQDMIHQYIKFRGIPTIVTANAIPATKYCIEVKKPPNINQIIFPNSFISSYF